MHSLPGTVIQLQSFPPLVTAAFSLTITLSNTQQEHTHTALILTSASGV